MAARGAALGLAQTCRREATVWRRSKHPCPYLQTHSILLPSTQSEDGGPERPSGKLQLPRGKVPDTLGVGADVHSASVCSARVCVEASLQAAPPLIARPPAQGLGVQA